MQTNIDFWPTTLKLKNSSDLICDESLRYLAGKRLVCRGRWQQRTVAVKLFFHPKSAKRHWLREKQGVETLISNQLSTPSLLFAGTLIDGTPVLIFDYLSSAKTALDVWKELDNDEARLDLLQQIVVEISAQHRCGLWQQDLHLGNFLISDNQIYTIDGDGIKSSTDGKELTTKKRRNNLALLLAQLSPNYDHLATPAIEHYAATSQKNMRDLKSITEKELPHIRTTRRHKYVKKAYRNCSEFIRHNSLRQVAIYRRDADAGLIKQFLNNPDQLITDGTILKNGNSATVAQVTIAGDSLAIKRYNIKGIWHILKRCWRPTRAWISWGNAHRLTISGIDTPQPIAILEKRLGPLRTSSYYLCVHENTPSATDYFSHQEFSNNGDNKVAQQFVKLFTILYNLGIYHGDCKATNFLIKNDHPWIIDLDSMTEFRWRRRFLYFFMKDRRRFLLNWVDQPKLHHWFDEHLPR